MKKHSFTISQSILDDDYIDFTIIGIVTTMSLSNFLYYTEQSVEIYFKIHIDKCKEINGTDGQVYFFETYEYYDNRRYFMHHLHINEKNGNYLLSEAENVQLIWIVKGIGANIDKNAYVQKMLNILRHHPHIQYAMEIKHENIKSKEMLLF